MLKCSVWLLYDKIWYCITWFKKSAKNKNGFKGRRRGSLMSFVLCSFFLDLGPWTLEQWNSTRVFLKKFKIKKSFLKKEVWQCSILLEWLKNIVKPVHSSVFSSVDSVPSL